MPKLGINIDHIATIRQARRELDPDPVAGAKVCEKAGAHSIVCHLREDRRHINDRDVIRLKKSLRTKLTLEMSINERIVAFALKVRPSKAMIVPEKRKEVTTEGGLDVIKSAHQLKRIIPRLAKRNIEVCLFVDPDKKQIDCARKLGVDSIELHTGCYANAKTKSQQAKELQKLRKMSFYAHQLGLIVNAGHGLKYHNVKLIAKIEYIHELNIGHSIISKAVFVGLEKAVKEMFKQMKG